MTQVRGDSDIREPRLLGLSGCDVEMVGTKSAEREDEWPEERLG